jgi:hypothetical protein
MTAVSQLVYTVQAIKGITQFITLIHGIKIRTRIVLFALLKRNWKRRR